MFVFELPEIGEGVIEGEIVSWKVKEGETIAQDQPLCEIMTDKATVEISSPKTGLVARLHGAEGDVIQVHAPLVDIDLNGAASEATAPAKKAAPATKPKAAKAPAAAKPAPVAAPTPAAVPTPARSGKTLASPAVRSHARDQNIDINQVQGSGKAGRITKADLDTHNQPAAAIKAPPALQVPGPTPEDQTIRIIGLRRKIAEKMVESYRTIPHFTYVDEIDATRLYDLRKSLKDYAAGRGVNLTYLPFIMKALCIAFRDFPTVNSTMDEEKFEVTVRGQINIGIATDTEGGLVVPVVKDVANKSLLQLGAEVIDLTTRTRNGKAQLHELQGGTFTITSVGNIGGRFATPIINHPQVAILGVNQIHDRPMVIDGQIVARKMMYLSPSFDHRVIDGALGARFVARLKDILEHPAMLFADQM